MDVVYVASRFFAAGFVIAVASVPSFGYAQDATSANEAEVAAIKYVRAQYRGRILALSSDPGFKTKRIIPRTQSHLARLAALMSARLAPRKEILVCEPSDTECRMLGGAAVMVMLGSTLVEGDVAHVWIATEEVVENITREMAEANGPVYIHSRELLLRRRNGTWRVTGIGQEIQT